jgi:hypothetical protein
MAASDSQFRYAVLVGGALLVGVITYLRFCGSLSLPPKPPPPTGPRGTERQLLVRSTGTPAIYQSYLERDAATAGVAVPSLEAMSKKFAYRVDEARHVLEPGQPPIEIAGLRVHLERSSDAVVMVIQNLVASDLAYEIATTPSAGAAVCNTARPLPFNALVIAKRATETRTECAWRDGSSIIITKAETFELPALSSWYLRQVPPALVGIEDRIARGHRAEGKQRCSTVVSAVVKGLIERGDLGWRDLADFYARHRCETYQFPSSYRAFKSDGERQLPAVDAAL